MKNKGFSLVELIVVIAIMAILVGVAVPVYTSYIDKAKETKDAQYLDELSRAAQIFAAENGLVLESIWVAPEITDTQGILLYTVDGKVYQGDMSKLYTIVGPYDFETIETDEVIYFTPVTENEGTDGMCEHEHTETVAGTCMKQGYVYCVDCTEIISVGTFASHVTTTETIGNLTIERCQNCGHAEYNFAGDKIGS